MNQPKEKSPPDYEAGGEKVKQAEESGTVIILRHMHPIVLSLLLGLTAAAANVFGGAIIVQKHWDRSYLRYFVALGAGFMLATATVEVFPAALELRGMCSMASSLRS